MLLHLLPSSGDGSPVSVFTSNMCLTLMGRWSSPIKTCLWSELNFKLNIFLGSGESDKWKLAPGERERGERYCKEDHSYRRGDGQLEVKGVDFQCDPTATSQGWI